MQGRKGTGRILRSNGLFRIVADAARATNEQHTDIAKGCHGHGVVPCTTGKRRRRQPKVFDSPHQTLLELRGTGDRIGTVGRLHGQPQLMALGNFPGFGKEGIHEGIPPGVDTRAHIKGEASQAGNDVRRTGVHLKLANGRRNLQGLGEAAHPGNTLGGAQQRIPTLVHGYGARVPGLALEA